MSNGVPVVSNGYPNMPDLHRELFVQQCENQVKVVGVWRHAESRVEASAVQSRKSTSARRVQWIYARKGWQLL